jgi:hypothetical protein
MGDQREVPQSRAESFLGWVSKRIHTASRRWHIQRARHRYGNATVEKLKKHVIILDIFSGR